MAQSGESGCEDTQTGQSRAANTVVAVTTATGRSVPRARTQLATNVAAELSNASTAMSVRVGELRLAAAGQHPDCVARQEQRGERQGGSTHGISQESRVVGRTRLTEPRPLPSKRAEPERNLRMA